MHEAYGQLVAKFSEGYSEEQIANYTKAEDVAEIIYDAATDGKSKLRYIVGKNVNSTKLQNKICSILFDLAGSGYK